MGAKALMISHMFPNAEDRIMGVFVEEKARALGLYIPTTVVAPVSYFPFVRWRTSIDEFEEVRGLKIHHPRYLALPGFQFGRRWLPYYLSLNRFLKGQDRRANILFVEWVYPDAFAAAKYAAKNGVRLVVTVHGNRAIGYYGPPDRRDLYAYPLRLADCVVAVSEELRVRLIESYRVPPEKITVIHNGIDPGQFHRMPREFARRRLGLPVDRPIVLSVGRLSEEKSQDVLIRAFARCPQARSLLYIIGDGPLRQRLHDQITKAGLGGRVFLTGAVEHDKIHEWFCAADVFCLSSQHEGCPVVIHEALACGTPIVATRVGAIAKLVSSGEYGMLCEPGEPGELALLLAGALTKQWNRKKISEYGSQFTWDKVARHYLEIARISEGRMPVQV